VLAVESYAKSVGASKVRRVTLLLGELQSVDVEVFKEALNIAKESSSVPIEEVHFENEKALLECRKCGSKWTLEEAGLTEEQREAVHFVPELVHAFARCPRCGSVDFEVARGRGVVVKEVLVEAPSGD